MSLQTGVQLLSRITCPHCWEEFAPDALLWIAAHADLRGDPLLVDRDEHQRFLPSRFNAEGKAIDTRGEPCKYLACPHCHLSISWSLLEMKPLFISILGAPGSGKSYFLASMTWQLRKTLQSRFAIAFADADPLCNQVLTDYEEKLFLNPDEDKIVYLPKTELEGQLYQSVIYGEQVVLYPRPFVFAVQPLDGHVDYVKRRVLSRALCLYDNAGEHFMPGGETSKNPSRHLALSEVLFFLFDPTQHPKFRKQCKGKTSDPQMGEHGWSHRQDQILLEAASRIRQHSGSAQTDKYKRPLIVVLTKLDAWRSLAPDLNLDITRLVRKVGSVAALDLHVVRETSDYLRRLLHEYAPEMVAAAETFAETVTYLPVSALGRAPELVDARGGLGIRPKNVHPAWAEVPMLCALNQATHGLVRAVTRRSDSAVTPLVANPAPPTDRAQPAAAALEEQDDEALPRLRETGT
ncbi:MAG: hypothetical protein NTY19_03120 [Planctomycetota bacterium]|nr:hypothetical protein [Planctomycetota bacterium]